MGALVQRLGTLVGAWLLSGCSCQVELPPDPPDADPPEQPPPPDEDTGDTGFDPRCFAREQEPNDVVAQANPVPMEKVVCGELDRPGDLDWFRVELDHEGWLHVRADAKPLGSFADVHLLVQGHDGTVAVRDDNLNTTDASLTFPALPQVYEIQVAEQNNQGDADRYFYELFTTVGKPPVAWTRMEVEPNDQPDQAEWVEDGDVIFGFKGASVDPDWFRVQVPPGRHTVRFTVEAFHHGSAGDFALLLVNADNQPLPLGCNPCAFVGPADGYGVDPGLVWESMGNEELRVNVFERAGRNGRPVWYTLRVELEGP